MKRTSLPTLKFEEELYKRGFAYIAGVDEVGRGSWAGPVVAAAVIFDAEGIKKLKRAKLKNVRDSKLLNAKNRAMLSNAIRKHSLAYSISEVGVREINRFGIGRCCQIAFLKAIKSIRPRPDHVLVDAFAVKGLGKKKQTPIIKGDRKCFSIAAASIIAKCYRDELMEKLNASFSEYCLDRHKGYGTKLHQSRIDKFGLSKIHRRSFKIGDLRSIPK